MCPGETDRLPVLVNHESPLFMTRQAAYLPTDLDGTAFAVLICESVLDAAHSHDAGWNDDETSTYKCRLRSHDVSPPSPGPRVLATQP